MEIRTIRKGFEAFDANSNHSKKIQSFRNQITTIWKRFEALECTL